MRNFATHQYDDLDPRRVWRTVTRDVPNLRAYIIDTVVPGLEQQVTSLLGCRNDLAARHASFGG